MFRAFEGNPFSTRHVRPGRLAFQFAPPLRPHQLVERLADQRWWGQIVGAHGVGKTTLLHTLAPLLINTGRTISWWTIEGGQRRLPAALWTDSRRWCDTTLVILDGYEQLSWLARRGLMSRCRRTRAGLLVTTHQDAGFPPLTTLACPLEILQRLVAQLLEADPIVIDPAEVSASYTAHRGNVRDVFFALYDLYEGRRSRLPSRSHLPS
ncbi:MAG: hypothetical protein ACYC6N_01310 [Pirellulaceae bacterium]